MDRRSIDDGSSMDRPIVTSPIVALRRPPPSVAANPASWQGPALARRLLLDPSMKIESLTCYAWSFEGAPVDAAGGARPLSWIRVPGEAALASTRATTALARARSAEVIMLRCFGSVEDDGTFHCTDAVRIAVRNVAPVLAYFARFCASSALPWWSADDVVEAYLATGDAALRAAAHQRAWQASTSLDGHARRAAQCAMFAAYGDRTVAACREASKLALEILGADSLRAALRAGDLQERALASALLREVDDGRLARAA
jgi:hypothetical protein